MPAISVIARVEAHMEDQELMAVADFLKYAIAGHYDHAQSLFLEAAKGDALTSGHMLTGTCTLYAAAQRAIRERNLTV